MKEPLDSLARRLAAMRQQFDASFTRPLNAAEAPVHKLLAIQAGAGRFALPFGECAGIYASPKVVMLPGAHPALLGIAGVRGRLTAVYRLAALLGVGYPAATPRWLLVCRADDQVGFGVENIEAYLQVSAAELFPTATPPEVHGLPEPYCAQMLIHRSVARPVLNLEALVAAVRSLGNPSPSAKEP